jgi:hypothetical protein
VYFLRLVLRALPDKFAVQALKALIPVLKTGVKILIQDVCMPEPNTIPLWRERTERYVVTRCLTTQRIVIMNKVKCADKFFTGRWIWLWSAFPTVAKDTWTNGKLYSLRQMGDLSCIRYMCQRSLCWASWKFSGMCLVPLRPEGIPIEI